MSEGFNRVLLLGNLGADPELKVTQGGQSVLKLRVATTERYLDKNGVRQERTEWHSVVIWGKRAEALHKFLTKGSTVLVEGSLRTTSYEDRDGNKRYRTEVSAQNIVLTGGRGGAARVQTPPDESGFSPAPQRSRPAPQASNDPDYPDDGPPPDLPGDDEIPF